MLTFNDIVKKTETVTIVGQYAKIRLNVNPQVKSLIPQILSQFQVDSLPSEVATVHYDFKSKFLYFYLENCRRIKFHFDMAEHPDLESGVLKSLFGIRARLVKR